MSNYILHVVIRTLGFHRCQQHWHRHFDCLTVSLGTTNNRGLGFRLLWFLEEPNENQQKFNLYHSK